ncbi:MAG: glycosyl hydrolase, partial [Gemmatimonadaceae bacterium]|nr:glycosyl hydrolase [Gemmatimonadaceae bacterium]
MLRRPLLIAVTALLPASMAAQGNVTRRDTTMINRSPNPLLANFRFRSIGPASMGGRIDAIDAVERDPRIIWIGYAVGGVFKSTNAGTTFRPVFEQYGSASIGDIAIDQNNPDIVYVGTGEPNNRQTSSFGDGIYKTTDGGRTFTHLGLRETQTIARVVLHPRNSDIVYVASPGHLFGPNPERGVFKSTNGGRTWARVFYVDEHTGVTDLAMDPANPNVLYAASYQRRRTGCCFNGGGPGSGLWKTENAGRTWTRLTSGGLPPGTWGRIALDVARSNPNVVYTQIETDGGDSAA